jgi:hypothetical protein
MVLRGLAALIAAHRDDRAGVAAHLRAADQVPGLPGSSSISRLDLPLARLGLMRVRAMAAERTAGLMGPPLSWQRP